MPVYKKVKKRTNKGNKGYELLIYPDGSKYWYKDGKLHRTSGPAYIGSNGSKSWYKDGKLHSTSGPAFISSDGSKYWYKDGELHRTSGPASISSDGSKYWYKDGKLHRTSGPAYIGSDGTKGWYLNGIEVNKKDFNKVRTCPLRDLPLYINTEFEPLVKERLKNA